ncbi:neurofilament heavy polypeptide-like protein [Labeo rohita]|uniref:Neurofilament heavy polypeptide-like protein n=1 Tax=Labeo rohita TaxID=84645 RepID=A0A498LVY6_LABRO|nr:neurofilament heavy polypeptide-like protein [Labeo rohita]RXN39477.1 neurofilament heavy polypeptide-like protein [Labeo rohita]
MRQDVLQQKPQASSVHGAPVPNKTPERQRLKIPEPLSKQLLQLLAQASSLKGAPVSQKTPERQKLTIAEPVKQDLLQQKPQVSPVQGAPMASKSPQGAGVLARSSLAEAVPGEPLKGAAVPSETTRTRKRRVAKHQSMSASAMQALPRTSKVVPVHSGTLQGARKTKGSPQGSKSQNDGAAEAEAEGSVEAAESINLSYTKLPGIP